MQLKDRLVEYKLPFLETVQSIFDHSASHHEMDRDDPRMHYVPAVQKS